MPVVLATGRTLIDPDFILDAIGAQGKVFADLRCGGHGHFVIAASKKLQEPGRVIALDPMSGNISALSSKLAEHGHGSVEVMLADLESSRGVPLKNGEVQVALLANAMHMMAAPMTAFNEIRRIIESGGTLAIIHPKSSSPFYALAKTRGIGEDTARYFTEEHGFACERNFDAGPHHICLVFRKI